MSPSQTKTLQAFLWPKAAQAQGWPVKDRAFRLRVLGEILEREIASAAEINSTDEFDRVKRELERCAGELRGAMDTDQAGRERRLRHKSREAVDCVRVYLGDATERYCRAALVNKHMFPGVAPEWLRQAAVEELIEMLDDASASKNSPLRQAESTLWRIAHAKRKAAGDSVAQMREKAGGGVKAEDVPF